MKRHFMKSLMALCAAAMAFCAGSSLFVSCDKYDDTELREQIGALDERLTAVENLKGQLADLVAKVDALYTLQFQVSDSNELQYSFDGGKTWKGTGIVLVEECNHECPEPTPPCDCVPVDPCTCPEVTLVDNGDSVTITVGDASFTIEKPQEIVFEIRAGKLYFASESTQKVTIKSSGIEDITVMSFPKGWYAEIASDGMLEVTAPNYDDTIGEFDYETYTEIPGKCAASGYVKVHACSAEGKCMVGKLPVEVSNRPVSVKAFGGKAYFTATSNNNYAPEFYYGMSPRESFEAEVADLLAELNAEGWSNYKMNDGEFDVVADVAELLGAEPEKGVEYVAWAIVSDWNVETYTMDNFVVAYYQVVEVTAVEDESKRTAYNVTATVTVEGADKYLALAIPANYLDYEGAIDEYKENMVMSLSPDSWSGPMGKYYTESYTGSVLDIAEGTTASMSGNYAPDLDIYLLILPMDGRAVEDYTVEDIHQFVFTTAPLTAGGAVDANAEQVFTYMAQEYDNEIWDYVMVEKVVDKYSQLAVKIEPSATNWVAFYYLWLEDAEWQLYGGDDELLVSRLLEEWGMTPTDVEFPYYDCLDTDPATTNHFVALFVDENGKYGKLAKISATTEELVYSDIVFTEPYETNLTDGVLKNTTEFMFKPTVEGGTAASYKYYWLQTDYYNPYEGMDDATLAQTIHFDRDNRGVVVEAADLVDGYIVVPNNEYGSNYMVAVLPYDENGAPGKSAAIFNFSSAFELDAVITEGAEFEATKPQYSVALPEVMDENGDGAIYYYSWVDYYSKYQFSYELNVAITPAEGTTVMATFVNATNTTLSGDALTDASALWQGSIESWYNYSNITEPFESSNRLFNHYDDTDAPDVWFIISWVDAEGNYYYEAKSLQAELQKLADKMYLLLYHSPYMKQYAFNWTEYAAMMGLESMSACIDLGVSAPGYFMAGIDYEAIYGEEAAGMWMAGMEGYFEMDPIDETSGVVTIMRADYMTGELAPGPQMTYSNYTGTTCTFNCPDLYITNVEGTLMTETVLVNPQGVAM